MRTAPHPSCGPAADPPSGNTPYKKKKRYLLNTETVTCRKDAFHGSFVAGRTKVAGVSTYCSFHTLRGISCFRTIQRNTRVVCTSKNALARNIEAAPFVFNYAVSISMYLYSKVLED